LAFEHVADAALLRIYITLVFASRKNANPFIHEHRSRFIRRGLPSVGKSLLILEQNNLAEFDHRFFS